MTTATATALHATMAPSGQKIVVRGSTPALAGFLHALPSGRWNGSQLAWTCDATPAAAHRLCCDAPAAVQADAQVTALSVAFREAQRRAVAATIGSKATLAMPAVRKTDPWEHQLRAYHFADALDAALLALAMGTGKSKITVDLAINQEHRTGLIVCPASVRGVWRREFDRHAGGPMDLCILEDGSVKDKAAQADMFLTACKRRGRPGTVVINYESAREKAFADWSCGQLWDFVACDESHRIKAHDSKQSKYLAALRPKAGRRLCLTGTPMAQSPLDVFGQFRFLDPGIYGTWWHEFRSRYAILREMGPGGPKAVVGYQNQEELAHRFALLAYRVEADVLDLPPVTHNVVPVTLGPKAAKAYRQLERDMIADVQGGVVTVANALVRGLRLQQVTSGYTVLDEDDEQRRQEVELDNAKECALFDLLADLGQPAVVFCTFKHDLRKVEDVCGRLGKRYGELSGRRKDLTEHAEYPPDVDVMGVQYQSGGVGVDLTRAQHALFYSGTWSLANFDQALARLVRPGQRWPVCCYHFVAAGTIDQTIADAIQGRREIIQAVLARMLEA